MHIEYGTKEIEYLKSRDKKLGQAIEQIGHIHQPLSPDLFSSVIHHIIGQQISIAAQKTIWNRLNTKLPVINAETILSLNRDELQTIGITYKKAEYILDFADKVHTGAFDIHALNDMTDEEVIAALSSLNGIGVWTAEMLMIFSMGRKNIVSFGDLAIIRGMRMLYRHRKIDREKFNRFKKRYSPYGTVASLYLWAIAGGAIPELTDPAPKKVKKNKK